jgi:hypothetical protein
MSNTLRKALSMISQESPRTTIFRDLAQWIVPPVKYRGEDRRVRLRNCFQILATEALFKTLFGLSIFTKLAINCAFT